jgi:hypothetical protein
VRQKSDPGRNQPRVDANLHLGDQAIPPAALCEEYGLLTDRETGRGSRVAAPVSLRECHLSGRHGWACTRLISAPCALALARAVRSRRPPTHDGQSAAQG